MPVLFTGTFENSSRTKPRSQIQRIHCCLNKSHIHLIKQESVLYHTTNKIHFWFNRWNYWEVEKILRYMKENNFDLIDSRSLQFDNNIQHTFSLRFLYHQRECHTTNGDEGMWKNVTVRKSGYFRSESLDNFTCQIQLHAQQRGKYLSSLFWIPFFGSAVDKFSAKLCHLWRHIVYHTLSARMP